MIHWAGPGNTQGLCSAKGLMSYEESDVTCGECLYHLITEHLESHPVPLAKLHAILALLDS